MRRRTLGKAVAAGLPALLLAPSALASAAPVPAGARAVLADFIAAHGAPRLGTVGRRLRAAIGDDSRHAERALERALNPEDYACAPTGLAAFVADSLKDWDEELLSQLAELKVLEWPTFDALLFGTAEGQSFGINGEHTKELRKTFRNLQSFWDLDGSDISLLAMHGRVLLDVPRMARLVEVLFEIPARVAVQLAAAVAEIVDTDLMRHGDHPIFTLNAFAYSEKGQEPEAGMDPISDRIVMGDGILEAFTWMGLTDVAPRGILAHEYGHQLQHRLGLFIGHRHDAEATRQTELEADAFAGYYLSHPRGERLRNKRVEAFIRVDHEVGDCGFDSSGHHGTPNQRAATGTWADALANRKGAKGHVLPAAEVSRLFRLEEPRIVAPDA